VRRREGKKKKIKEGSWVMTHRAGRERGVCGGGGGGGGGGGNWRGCGEERGAGGGGGGGEGGGGGLGWAVNWASGVQGPSKDSIFNGCKKIKTLRPNRMQEGKT